jgi:S-DNA-T family DNA segregation ATPase FtsK/SpoIIIE
VRFVVTLRDGSPAGTQTEVLVDSPPDASFAALLPRLLAALDDGTHPSFAPNVRVWVDGVPVVPDEHTVAGAGLGPGAVVELHAPRERPAVPPSGIAEIRVVNGPGSGRVHRLSLGHTVVGYEAPGMGLADRRVPADALTVVVRAGGGVQVEPGRDAAGATLDGAPLRERRAWAPQAALAVGRTVLELAPLSASGPPRPRGLTVEVGRRPGSPRPAPDPAGLLLAAINREPALWSRFAGDPGRLRLGLDEAGEAVTLDLLGAGVLGLAGDQPTARAVAAWLLSQAVTLYGPDQLRAVVLTTGTHRSRQSWEWLVRVPHCDPSSVATAPDDPEPPFVAMIGTDDHSVGRRVAELTALAADRRLVAATATGPADGPQVVVVLDGARQLRDRPGVSELLTYGPAAGIHLVCLEDDAHHLPESCDAVVTCTPESLTVEGRNVRPDLVEPAWTDRLSRALARLRPSAGEETPALGFELPGPPGLGGMLGVDPPSARAVLDRWASSPSSRTLVGTGQEGPFAVDLRLDGPHVLLAGAPDAGTDDLLRLVLTALAVANRPDHLGLVLIGPRRHFGDCARLPHVVGAIDPTERGGPATLRRAVLALGAAMDRMPAVDDLTPPADAGPRLVIAVHDVVELCRAQPEAMAPLVDLGFRAGPLGPNLVLGTASPELIGAVDVASALCSGVTGRLCLRVGDDAGSRAVIDTTDAARIPRRAAGTGYARAGHWPLLAFRAPSVGRLVPATTGADEPPLAWPLGWEQVGNRVPTRSTPAAAGAGPVDDVSRLVAAVRVAAESLALPPPAAPWLPPLPDLVPVDSLARVRPGSGPASGPGPASDAGDPARGPHRWALADAPAEQQRTAVGFELGRGGHLLLIGRAGSGRTTALRTLAGVLADRVSSADLHGYVLDAGGGGLAAAAGLPITGTLLTAPTPDRSGQVLTGLVEEVVARRERLTAGGWADLDEQRAAVPADQRLPYLLLLVDRWDRLVAGRDGLTLTEQTLLLLRRGGPAGLHVVLSGDRSLLQGRISALNLPRLLLRPDRVDCRLAGLDPAHLPERLPPGRGLWAETGAETQVAVLGDAGPGPAQEEALAAVARRRARRDASVPASLRPRAL